MSYRLNISDSAETNFSRIIGEQIERALQDLQLENAAQGNGVHEARKRFKKARGVLRLMRPAIGDDYKRLNTLFRDAGRKLAPIRDLESLQETCDALQNHYERQVKVGLFEPIRRNLADRRRSMGDSALLSEAVSEVKEMLEQANAEIKATHLELDGFDAFGGGVTKYYKRGAKALRTAYDDPTVENFHELRKRAKDHRYHIRLLQDLWHKPFKGLRKSLNELTDLLGDDHDLSVLYLRLQEEPDLAGRDRDEDVLGNLIDTRRQELRRQIRPLALKVYAEKPDAFCHRVKCYWKAAQLEA